MEVLDGSQRSLRSVSLENNLSRITAGESELSTPVQLPPRPQPLTHPGTNSSPKVPSYLGISCAVNGYNRLNRYDSSLRDGFRSRDASPARLAFSRSRDSSPMRPEWKALDSRTKISPQATADKIRELKEELAKFKAEFPHPPGERGRQSLSRRPGRKPSQGRSISVDRGYLTKASLVDQTMNGHAAMEGGDGPRVHLVKIEVSEAPAIRCGQGEHKGEEGLPHTNGHDPDNKSFIQSRIERLYGPSALAAGFRSRRSLLELEKEQKDREAAAQGSPSLPGHHYDPDAKAPEGFPSVFRHLRPEFRTQLQVRRSNGGFTPPHFKLPSLEVNEGIESPKRPGRVIPITLTGKYERQKPPLQPKPDLASSVAGEGGPPGRPEARLSPTHTLTNGKENSEEVKVSVERNSNSQVNGSAVEQDNKVKAGASGASDRTSSVNGAPHPPRLNGSVTCSSPQKKDGHYFLKVVEEVVKSLEVEARKVELDLENCGGDMSEDVRGKLLAGLGKARLLISQKIQQFQGLCHKNIAGSEGEEFPTTCEDLAGFWDMVSIQVEDIHHLMREIDTLRANDWKEVSVGAAGDGVDGSVTTGRARRRPAPRPSQPTRSSRAPAEKTAEGKSKDEARRRMMEERRRAMKEAMKAKKAEAEARGGQNSVEIFVPDSK